MPNSNRGLIGLPLKPVQSRTALALSAIQEERASLDIVSQAAPVTTTKAAPIATTKAASVASTKVASIATTTSSSPLTTVSSSKSDSSPVQSQSVYSLLSASANVRACSVAKFKGVQSAATRMLRAQSARTNSTFMTSVKAQKSVKSKDVKSSLERTHSAPCFDEPTTTAAATWQPSPREMSEALSLSCFNESLMDETVKQTPEEEQTTRKTVSLRSRPLPTFDDLLASDKTSPEAKEGREPRMAGTRVASDPTALKPRLKSSTLSPSEEQWTNIEALDKQRELTVTDEKGKLKRSKSFTKSDKQNVGPYLFLENYLTRERASSFNGTKGHNDGEIPILEDRRSRSLSDSTSAMLIKKKRKPTLRLRHYEGNFLNRRGQNLFYFALFPPKKMAMRGIVLHLHGMGDHCRRNKALYERYCKEGFGVITYDLLNHGESEFDKYNIRAHISNFDDFVDDTNDFITFAKSSIYKIALRYWRKHLKPVHPHGREKERETLPELPLIISGASFGSLIGIYTILSGEHKFHAAVWASPVIGVAWTPVLWAQWKFTRALIAALPTVKVIPAVQHHLRSRDPKFLKKYQDDPLTCSDMITPRSGYQSLHAMMRLQREKRVSDAVNPFCGISMLFLAGSDDRVSDQQAAIKFYNRMESPDKEFKLFDGLYHMIYEEPEKEEVFKYLVNWLHKRFPLETRHPNNSHLKES
ncbi:unnamed protein product [Peronospora effusa]|nr:unnamed protein product [Peronospora effusa]